MEEDDELAVLDYRTPKGRLIKLLEQKMKKPQIDDSLGKVLDQVSQLTRERTTYLENGIFYMNFAEDALLLQICGQYYAKRVDLLWEEMLQFHTRMVKYDQTTAKNCTDGTIRDARKQEIARLEERLNRGKRKKIVLAEPEGDITPKNGCYVFDLEHEDTIDLYDNIDFPLPEEDEVVTEEQAVAPFEHDYELFADWRQLYRAMDRERRRNGYSSLVMEYHKLRYRLKNYPTSNMDEMIYDMMDPEEFNTRAGRLITFHHIKHLFEYNDYCLLPDEDFTVAKLRIAYSLQRKWFMKNKIDPDAPYETYKEAWEKYQREFFANEKRKIQNMPQRNSEELMRFYKALARKEQLARQKVEKLRAMGVKNLPGICFENVIVAPAREGYEGIFDPYIPDDFDCPTPVIDLSEDTPSQHSDGDHEAELRTLLGDFPKLPDPSTQMQDKPRSDSGYFDGGFEGDDESDHEEPSENAVTGTDTPFEFDKGTTENNEDALTSTTPLEATAEPDNINTEEGNEISATSTQNDSENNEAETPDPENPSVNIESPFSNLVEPQITELQLPIQSCELDEDSLDIRRDEMNKAIKEFSKQGSRHQNLIYNHLENSYFKKTDDMIMIVYDKPEEEDDDESLHGDKIVVFGYFTKQDELAAKRREKMEKNREPKEDTIDENKKRKLEQSLNNDPPPKRRRLSRKQVEKLKRSLIAPVKNQHWEHFFSLNYQAESGEGQVSRVEYEPDIEDEDLFSDADHLVEPNNHNDAEFSGYLSEHDGVHIKDGNNCRPESTTLPSTQDSGIGMDTSFTDVEEDSEKNHDSSEQQNNLIDKEDSPNGVTDLENFDILAEFTKNHNIPWEELDEPAQKEKPTLTPHEQECEEAKSRVTIWREHMMVKLKNLDEHDFDIHEYGSNIMNNIPSDETKPFSELVSGKSSAEVVRYFVSSLQLANTLNVEICGAKKGELSNNTFGIKLINKERYHEHFQEYQAPSEETLRDRVKKIKEIRMQNQAQRKQSAKRQSSEYQDQPQSILKKHKTLAKSQNSLRTPTRKIKILGIVNVVSPANRQSLEQLNAPRDRQEIDFQQPSTSWQADIMDQQCDIAQTPARSSVDSGFIPSCDEDFLEQFDQLQQINYSQLQSTPIKPRKILKISLIEKKGHELPHIQRTLQNKSKRSRDGKMNHFHF